MVVQIACTPVRQSRTHTYLTRGIRVGAGIDQQPRAVRATILGGTYQRRAFALQRARAHCDRVRMSKGDIQIGVSITRNETKLNE